MRHGEQVCLVYTHIYTLIYIHSPHNMVEYGVHILPTLCNIRTPVCMYVCVCVFSVFRKDNETSTQATLAPYMNQFYRCQDVHCKQCWPQQQQRSHLCSEFVWVSFPCSITRACFMTNDKLRPWHQDTLLQSSWWWSRPGGGNWSSVVRPRFSCWKVWVNIITKWRLWFTTLKKLLGYHNFETMLHFRMLKIKRLYPFF